MFNLNEDKRIVMAQHPTDMRMGVNGMCGQVRKVGLEPSNGDVYIFVGKSRTTMKLLHWERGGYVMNYKRSSKAVSILAYFFVRARASGLCAGMNATIRNKVTIRNIGGNTAISPQGDTICCKMTMLADTLSFCVTIRISRLFHSVFTVYFLQHMFPWGDAVMAFFGRECRWITLNGSI